MSIRLRPGAIARTCAELGCSRSGLARRLDVAESTVYRLEREDQLPSPRVIAALLRLADASFEDLFVLGDERA